MAPRKWWKTTYRQYHELSPHQTSLRYRPILSKWMKSWIVNSSPRIPNVAVRKASQKCLLSALMHSDRRRHLVNYEWLPRDLAWITLFSLLVDYLANSVLSILFDFGWFRLAMWGWCAFCDIYPVLGISFNNWRARLISAKRHTRTIYIDDVTMTPLKNSVTVKSSLDSSGMTLHILKIFFTYLGY